MKMKSGMLLKLVYFIHLPLSMSHYLAANVKNSSEGNVAETKIITKLIEESKRVIVLVMNSNSTIVERFLQSHDLPITVDINDLKTYTKTRKIGATILHFGRYADFESFYGLIKSDMFLNGGHFVIIYDSCDAREIEKIFSNFWKIYIYNVAVLVTDTVSPDVVSVFTYMPFINESCGNTNPIRINEFNKTSMTWTTNVFFPEKFKQLNQCPLRFGCYNNRPGFIIGKSESGVPIFAGMNVDIVNMFSEILNFSLAFMEYEEDVGVIYENKTATALLKRTIENEVDIMFTSIQADRTELLSATRIVYSDKIILVVPPPFLIDAMTKIFLPFTFSSWFSIGMVALVACCTVITLKFTPKMFHDHVIGSNVKGSILNVCNIFLGGPSLEVLPRSNFPRFLLAMFLVFTMIIRSLYQGGVFDLMKRDVHTVELKTLDAFVEHQFTFYIYRPLNVRLAGTKFLLRHIAISNAEVETCTRLTLDPSFRGVVFKHFANTVYINSITRKNFTLRIAGEPLFMTAHGFYFTKNFYLVNEFDLLIETFETAGLIEHNMRKYVNMDSMKTTEKKPPSALTYGNIEGFFQLFYYGCAVAIVSFMCEIIYDYVKHNRHDNIFHRLVECR